MLYFLYGKPNDHFIIKDFVEENDEKRQIIGNPSITTTLKPTSRPLFSFCLGILRAREALQEWSEEWSREYLNKYERLFCEINVNQKNINEVLFELFNKIFKFV